MGAYLILAVWCVPPYKAIYDELGLTNLPLPTQAVLSLSAFAADFWYLVVIVTGAMLAVILSGMLDRIAKRGAFSCVILFMVWLGGAYLACAMPIIKMQQSLGNR